MWLCKGLGVPSDSEIQRPYPPWHQGQGGVHLTEAESGGCSSDGTASAMAGLRLPEAREPEARGPGRGGWLRQQEMEEDGNERQRSGDFGVKQGLKRHCRIAREGKRTE